MTTSHDYQYSNRSIYGIKSDAVRYTWAGYLLFVLASSLIGDTIILIASIKCMAFKLHKVIVTIIQHIAFCDLMVTITGPVPNFVSLICNEWVFGNFLCHLRHYTGYYFNMASILLICAMTTSKLLLLKYPLRFKAISAKKPHMVCGVCWLAATIMPVVFLLVAVFVGESIFHFSYISYTCEDGFTLDIWYWLKPLLTVLVVFIPNCLVVVTTIYLLVIAKEVARRGRESLKWQGIMTTVLTAVVYCISGLPYAVYNVGESIVSVDDESTSFFHVSYFRIAYSFLFLNTISNFYIYSLSVNSFRDFIWSRMQQIWRMFTKTGTSDSQGKGKVFS